MVCTTTELGDFHCKDLEKIYPRQLEVAMSSRSSARNGVPSTASSSKPPASARPTTAASARSSRNHVDGLNCIIAAVTEGRGEKNSVCNQRVKGVGMKNRNKLTFTTVPWALTTLQIFYCTQHISFNALGMTTEVGLAAFNLRTGECSLSQVCGGQHRFS
jgi:hypothetical protein